MPSQHWLAKTLVEQAANDKLCRLLRKMRSNLGLDKVPKVKLCRRTRLDSRMPSKQAINTNEAAGTFVPAYAFQTLVEATTRPTLQALGT